MIIGIVGFAQTGKDLIASILSDRIMAQRIAFADPVKRVVRDLFEFDEDQLWGTKQQKEAPDLRYPREHVWDPEPYYSQKDYGYRKHCLCCDFIASHDDVNRGVLMQRCYLTPRYAMKTVGTEGARAAWDSIWVKKALDDAKRVQRGFTYSRRWGAEPSVSDVPSDTVRNVVFPDTRFINEVEGLRAAGGLVYRVKRPGYDKPAFNHPSETEQLQIPDDKLDGVILNDGTPEDLDIKLSHLFV